MEGSVASLTAERDGLGQTCMRLRRERDSLRASSSHIDWSSGEGAAKYAFYAIKKSEQSGCWFLFRREKGIAKGSELELIERRLLAG